jgi:hypothetical protein
MSDITAELSIAIAYMRKTGKNTTLLVLASNEITRLAAELAARDAEVERMREACKLALPEINALYNQLACKMRLPIVHTYKLPEEHCVGRAYRALTSALAPSSLTTTESK